MTRLDLVTATSQEATDRHTLVVAEGARRTAELALKRLLVGGAGRSALARDDRSRRTSRTTGRWRSTCEAALKRALSDRTDLAQAKQQVAANNATLQYLRDQTRPQADVVANYALAGLGGTQLVRATDLHGRGGVHGARDRHDSRRVRRRAEQPAQEQLSDVGRGAQRHVSDRVQRRDSAEAARAQIQANQVAAQTHQLEVQVVTEVTDAAIDRAQRVRRNRRRQAGARSRRTEARRGTEEIRASACPRTTSSCRRRRISPMRATTCCARRSRIRRRSSTSIARSRRRCSRRA